MDFKKELNKISYFHIKNSSESKTIHPTQKPVEILLYLIKPYSNEGNHYVVLDFTMRSASAGVACKLSKSYSERIY
jgi:DNA modification methylase